MVDEREHHRAERILFTIDECHKYLDAIYEGLVDRDFESSKTVVLRLIAELKQVIKSMQDDDF